MKRKFLTAEWRNLIMANYVVDPKILLPHLPNKTELDTFNGNTYVSLVGFLFAQTKLASIKIPFHVNFEEVNLRFYVRYKDNGVWKRGVTFIKEIVPRHAITFVANTFYNEKYCTMKMRNFIEQTANETKLGYHWRYQNQWNKIEATIGNTATAMQEGSEEEFIAEHYWGYSRHSKLVTCEYGVEHPRWNVYPVKSYKIDCAFDKLYGEHFNILYQLQPTSVFVAQGSAITVRGKRRL